ncbi:hypothetical protein A8924_4178 [Saccharopolyspora erythraea NRRL 2338]|uniref:Glyoxalase/bleomycin resistance protein/dioxygenase n=2 Tax=Saccharopolyspora erythraea TaxID=1836 RepID=A4FG87_SACEN|nr:VOC family protein [Saccharopolyspora erythraea]EQD81573.1 glyoxalase [Saccharopolyspora erythraea D]PFG96767.1 hypothetical protein A8924_4178 [Saccharopolyspora erythraea NRRL 2338]QRK87016.1 VOC family protein [Saccharopolyspora erythraea]CAM03062.1 glyoxalase/bleomycin resistance protein/dioxygenase [Saccharopolyspora erythraea NRRL 2338]
MPIQHLPAVVPVSDIDTADAWSERLFDRPADNRPMDGPVEWRITTNGWVQVHRDPTRAGTALLNLAVDDLDQHRTALDHRGLTTGPVETAGKDVRLSTTTDLDGNRITFIGNFRTDY